MTMTCEQSSSVEDFASHLVLGIHPHVLANNEFRRFVTGGPLSCIHKMNGNHNSPNIIKPRLETVVSLSHPSS